MTGSEFIRQSRTDNIVHTPTAVVRTSVQKQVGGYRKQLTHRGDHEIWWRLAAHGDDGIHKNKQAVYRRHANNMSRNYIGTADFEQLDAAVQSFLGEGGNPLSHVAAIRDALWGGTARRAIDCANNAFILGDHAAQRALLQRAMDLDPGVRYSRPWIKLACKRLIGRPACLWIFSHLARGSFSAALIADQEKASHSPAR
jgi:hypothetical protein